MKLDVAQSLRDKMPRYWRYIPKVVVRWLANTIHQDELNDLLSRHCEKQGVEFSKAVLDDLEISLKVEGEENIPTGTHDLIFASNHPLGGLDGMALIYEIGKRYPGKFKFLVNDILMAIPTFGDVFLPVNKHGKQKRNYVKLIDEAYSSDDVLGTFPAGLCSRKIHGKVRDLRWQKGFITKSIEYHRDVIPVYVGGRNSNFFYRLAKIRKFIGIKFNVEMIYLPSEVFKYRGKEIIIKFGEPISWRHFDDRHTPRQWASRVKKIVYQLGKCKY